LRSKVFSPGLHDDDDTLTRSGFDFRKTNLIQGALGPSQTVAIAQNQTSFGVPAARQAK
jgi:hypothetical protein